MFLGGQWVFWGASGFSDSLAPRASGCHSPMSRPEMAEDRKHWHVMIQAGALQSVEVEMREKKEK